METPDQLQNRFATPGVSISAGRGGLTRVTVDTPVAFAEVYLLGAHVTRYCPAGGDELLFISSKGHFEVGKPIRGGVPICFPWFGPNADNADAPMHGFARTREFTIESIARSGDDVAITLTLTSDEATGKWWAADFILRHRIVIGQRLSMTLEVQNTGRSAFSFEEALHTYFAVDDVRKATVTGLAGVSYIDKTDGMKLKQQTAPKVEFKGETDRLYLSTDATTTITNTRPGESVVIDKSGSNSTGVWNPWIDKARAMADFGDDEWPKMLCVETVNARDNAVTLAAGETHRMTATIQSNR